MLWFKKIHDEIEATAIDDSVNEELPEMQAGENLMGTLNPYLTKFYCLLMHRDAALQAKAEEAKSALQESQFSIAYDWQILYLEQQFLMNIFGFEMEHYLTDTNPGLPQRTEPGQFFVRRGWKIILVPLQVMFLRARNGDDGDDNLSDPVDESTPPPKNRLN
ncbi:MAG: hypothetical protein Q8R25_00405 [bacterium]|nr:hypothetical protein [bacterium]